MDSGIFTVILQLIGELSISGLFLIGSYIVYNTDKNKVSIIMLVGSVLILISTAVSMYFNYSMMYGYTNSDPLPIYNLLMYSYYLSTLAYIIFALAFTAFCCRIGNLRKRNEELEFLSKELAERDNKS